jgi:hypothetical protein
VEKSDLVTLLVAFAIVCVLAIFVQSPLNTTEEETGETQVGTAQTVIPTPAPTHTPEPEPENSVIYRISYTSDFYQYPRLQLPDSMVSFGASEPRWQTRTPVVFAYLSEPIGGISEQFAVSYPIWRVSCTLEADTHPESALARWILVDATTGEIIEGGELFHRSVMIKNVHVSGNALYFVVYLQDASMITLTLEVPQDVYDEYHESVL